MKLRLLCVLPADQALNLPPLVWKLPPVSADGSFSQAGGLQQLLPVTVTPHGRSDSEKSSSSETHVFLTECA